MSQALAAHVRPRAVVVMARAPDRAPAGPGRALDSLLGTGRRASLERVLILRALRWAGEVAPEAVHVAFAPADAGGEMAELVGPHVGLFAQQGENPAEVLGDASARRFAGPGGGPLLIAWPHLPRWRPDHASGALEDLAEGCGVSVGPVFDGGFYLLALAGPLRELFADADADWLGPDAMASAFAAASRGGLAVGMLRAERGLRRSDDVRALLADPLTDGELRALLEPT